VAKKGGCGKKRGVCGKKVENSGEKVKNGGFLLDNHHFIQEEGVLEQLIRETALSLHRLWPEVLLGVLVLPELI
jgi:hypothetical protein